MIEILNVPISEYQLILLITTGLLVGMTKTGVYNLGIVIAPFVAMEFGGMYSSAIALPILIFADLFGVFYYSRHASFQQLKKLIPFALIGVIIGTVAGDYIDDEVFKLIMLITIFASLGIMIILETRKSDTIPTNIWFAISMGILGGFTSMIGNLSGAVMALYLLSMKLEKNAFIGTAAWFFLVVNLIKMPFHVVAWESITGDSLVLSLISFPTVLIGAYLGIIIVKRMSNTFYRWFIMGMTLIGAILMIL